MKVASIWERFDDIASTEEVAEAQAQFSPIEAGDYEAVLESMESAFSKSGLPMLKGKFRIIAGGKYVFYNQVLQNMNYPRLTAQNIADAKEFIEQLSGEYFEFNGLVDLDTRIQNLPIGETFKIRVSYSPKDTEHNFPKLRCFGKAEELPFEVTIVPM